jgi:nucleoid-associated protein YgaU
MQQIERYGVIALVFLLVTIVAVSFWGDNKSPGFWSRLTGKAKKEEVAKVEPLPAPPTTSEQALTTPIPLSEVPPQHLASTPPPNTTPAPAPTGPATFPVLDSHAQPVQPAPLGNGGAPPTPEPFAIETAPPVGASEYVVQKGDSLALIARRTLGSEQRWTEIQALNPGVSPKSLRVGAKLKLPSGAQIAARPAPQTPQRMATKPAPKAAQNAPAKKAGARHTIQRGDTLSAIAERRLGSKARVQEILALNPGLDPRKLAVGASIRLPETAERGPVLAQNAPRSSGSDRPRVR